MDKFGRENWLVWFEEEIIISTLSVFGGNYETAIFNNFLVVSMYYDDDVHISIYEIETLKRIYELIRNSEISTIDDDMFDVWIDIKQDIYKVAKVY